MSTTHVTSVIHGQCRAGMCVQMKRACMRRRWNGARSSYAAQGPTAIGANDAFVQRNGTCALSEASGTLLAVHMHVCAFVVCMYLGAGLDEVCSKTDVFRPSQLCRRNLKLGSKRLAPERWRRYRRTRVVSFVGSRIALRRSMHVAGLVDV